MTISVTNIGTNSSGTNSTTISVTVGAGGVPSGALIVVGVSQVGGTNPYTGDAGSIADSGSNKYGLLAAANLPGTGTGFGACFYASNGAALVNTNTITWTSFQSNAPSINAVYATGCATYAPLDPGVTKVAVGPASDDVNPVVTSGTPQVSGELFIGIVIGSTPNSTETFTNSSGWSTPPNTVSPTNANLIAGGNQVNNGTGALTFGGTNSLSGSGALWTAYVFGFLPASASAIGIQDLGKSSNTSGATLTLTTGAIPTGNTIIVCASEHISTLGGSFSDSRSNTYTQISQAFADNTSTSNTVGNFYYAKITTALQAGDTITYTKKGTSDTAMAAFAVSGLDTTSPLDTAVTASSFNNTSTPSVTSGFPGFLGELFVGFYFQNGNNQVTQDSTDGNWQNPFDISVTNSGNSVGVAGGVLFAGSTSTKPQIYAPTTQANSNEGTVIAGFKKANATAVPFKITKIGATNGNTGATIALSSLSVPGSQLIVVTVIEANPSNTNIGTVADSAGNTYTLIKKESVGGTPNVGVFYTLAGATTITSITYTRNISGAIVCLSAMAASASSTISLDTNVTEGTLVSSSTSGDAAFFGELFIGTVASNAQETYTEDTADGWGNVESTALNGGASLNMAAQILSGTVNFATYAPTPSGANNYANIIVGFRLANATAPVTAPWTVTNLGNANNTSGATVGLTSLTIPAGAVIVVCTSEAASTSTPGTVTDSAGNIYIVATQVQENNGNSWATVFYAVTPVAVTSITFTKASSNDNCGISALYATHPTQFAQLDPFVTASAANQNTTVPTITSGVPTASNELYVGFLGLANGSTTFTEAGGWTNANHWSVANDGGNLAYKLGSSATPHAQTYNPTISTSQQLADIVIGFKPVPWQIINCGANANSTGATVALTGLNIPAGSLIVVGTSENNSSSNAIGSISDSASNSYTKAKQQQEGNQTNQVAGVFYTVTKTAVTSITYTKSVSGNNAGLSALSAKTASGSTPLDSGVTASAQNNSSTPTVTSGAASFVNELFVGFYGVQSGGGAPGSGFGLDSADGWVTASIFPLTNLSSAGALNFQVNSGTSAITYTPGNPFNNNWADIIVGFEIAVAVMRQPLKVYLRR